MEQWIAIIVSVSANLVMISLSFGKISQKVVDIKEDIVRLEKKQDLHNGLITRMAVVEKELEIMKGANKNGKS